MLHDSAQQAMRSRGRAAERSRPLRPARERSAVQELGLADSNGVRDDRLAMMRIPSTRG